MALRVGWVVLIATLIALGLLLAPVASWAAPAVHGPSQRTVGDLPAGNPQDSLRSVATLPVGDDPGPAAYDAATGQVYVPNAQSDNVSVLEGSTVVATVAVGTGPDLAVYDAGDGYVYVVNPGSEDLSVLDGTSVVATVPIGPNASFAVYASSPTYLYVGSRDGNVTVVENTSVLATLTLGGQPRAAAYDSADGSVYVIDPGNNESTEGDVAILQGLSVEGIAYGGPAPAYITYDDVSNLIYVVNSACPDLGTYGCGVSVIRGESYEGSVNFSSGYNGYTGSPAVDEANGLLYVPNHIENAVYVVNGTSIEATIELPPQGIDNAPNLALYIPAAGEVYVTNWTDFLYGSVQAIVGLTVGGALPVGNGPTSMTYDAADSWAYISNSESASVSIVGPVGLPPSRYTVTFTESGLPPATNWAVTLAGSTVSTSTGSIGFTEPNGTYPYAIQDVAGWHQTTLPYAASVAVSGKDVGETTMVFAQVTYPVTFNETGLADGTHWSVTFNGLNRTTNSSVILFPSPNGTFSFTLGPVPGYVSSIATGIPGVLSVSGPTSVLVVFRPTSGGGGPSTGPQWLPGSTGDYLVTGLVSAAALGVAIAFVFRERHR